MVVEIVEFVYIRGFEGVDRDIQPLYREKKKSILYAHLQLRTIKYT